MALMAHGFFRVLAIAGMEVCWLYAVLGFVQTWACDRCLLLSGLFLFYPSAFGLHRLLPKVGGNPLFRQALSWLVWLASAALFTGLVANGGEGVLNTSWIPSLVRRTFSPASFPTPELLTIAGSAVLWGCGKRLSRLSGDASTVLREFQFGVLILLVVFFLCGQLGLDIEELVPLTVVFFFFALTGLPANLLHGGPGATSKRRRAGWFGMVIAVVCLVLAAGLVSAYILKPELLNLVLSLLAAAARFAGRLIAMIIAFLASFLPDPEPQTFQMPAPSAGIHRDPSFLIDILKIPESVRRIAGIIVSGIWVVLFLAALWSLSSALLKWMLQKIVYPDGAEVETLSGAFREDLYALLKTLVRKMDHLLSRFLGIFGIARIRRYATTEPLSGRAVYRQLLRWSARKGFPRHRAQTPGEYLELLSKRLPGGLGEFSLITSGYLEERYGAVPTAPGDLEKIHSAWSRLKSKKYKKLTL